jgi:hypothetical protein
MNTNEGVRFRSVLYTLVHDAFSISQRFVCFAVSVPSKIAI